MIHFASFASVISNRANHDVSLYCPSSPPLISTNKIDGGFYILFSIFDDDDDRKDDEKKKTMMR